MKLPSRSRSRVTGEVMAPPPSATTTSTRSDRRATARSSSSRKAASPSSTKMRGIGLPASRSTSASLSATSHPSRSASWPASVDFPEPMNPIRAMFR